MKFLITGAYGFVGTNLCRYLIGRGHECDALDIPAARRGDVPYARVFAWDDIGGDGDRSPALCGYDAVVHLAGKAHDLRKVASEQSYFDINVGLTKRIFDALCEARAENTAFICFSSSKASADGNAYGRSKLAAEEYLRSAAGAGGPAGRISVTILRPAMIHGPGNKGNLNLLWGIARRGIPWPLAAFENRRSFTSVGNVCAAVEALAAKRAQGVCTYGVADDDMVSTNRLIELIAETCGRKARLWRIPMGMMRLAARVGDVCRLPLDTERLGKLTEDSFVDNSRLKAALGWDRMPVGSEDGFRITLNSFRTAAANTSLCA